MSAPNPPRLTVSKGDDVEVASSTLEMDVSRRGRVTVESSNHFSMAKTGHVDHEAQQPTSEAFLCSEISGVKRVSSQPRLNEHLLSKHQIEAGRVTTSLDSLVGSAKPRSRSSPSQGSYAAAMNTANRTVDVMVDVKYSTSPLDLYNLMFDSDFFAEFLTENQKVWDLEFEEWESRTEDPNLLMRDFHYTRPNSGVGPKEVYCEEHEENQHRDEHDYIETQTTTHTPYVTYGKSFHVLTHTKIAWVDREDVTQGCVLNVVLEIVWTGWCPFKGMVEGRVIDGQKQYSTDMDKAVREELLLQQQRCGAPRPNRAISSHSQKYIHPRRMSSRRSHGQQQKPRFVRFLSATSTSSSGSSGELDEKNSSSSDLDMEPSWMEKQQSPPPPSYLSESFGLHHRQTMMHRFRLAVLLLLVSFAMTLIVLRLSA